MAVPTNVLEDGRWVTRFLDPYQLLAQNRAQQVDEEGSATASSKAPTVALLTQTLARSPVLKEIYPARIRHQNKNDILMVTQDAVQIFEAHRDYTLERVAITVDFDAPIKSSRIVGLPRRLTKLEPTIKEEDKLHWIHDQDPVNTDENTKCDRLPQDIDHNPVIPDSDPVVFDGFRTYSAAGSSAFNASCDLKYQSLPPQMLLLVLESAKIVFLYAVTGSSEPIRFITSQVSLPVPLSSPQLLHRLGEHLAVDPRSVN